MLRSGNIVRLVLRRLTFFIILVSLVAGIASGMPLHASSAKMMKCCDKAKRSDGSKAAKAASLCCATDCSDPAPTTSASSTNFAPANVTVVRSVAEQIAELFGKERTAPAAAAKHFRAPPTRAFQPKFIQHSSFLI